ncbi:hypothetical protein F9C07_1926697 [Aspergillus flavus]|uniref:Uncharacterized protein n=1 Tax=Aspergillus flavus (strain ATCC 200026 / FGSC A1120 / IAM 13836 / NRRL 3357 / JCM 12722 / SRRC 167) TaxID=332952 RepID=A0A7U2MZ33_ASPFN|nr:hypothetical protein F9C07_1926697 [Aspergillus flavus]
MKLYSDWLKIYIYISFSNLTGRWHLPCSQEMRTVCLSPSEARASLIHLLTVTIISCCLMALGLHTKRTGRPTIDVSAAKCHGLHTRTQELVLFRKHGISLTRKHSVHKSPALSYPLRDEF